MNPDKRYQVFISSTFRDLQEERREIMQAILEFGWFPAGMELFPASDDASWKLIQQVIDASDYYLVVVAGRYGSVVTSEGISYTEKEYRYALEKGIPIIGFLHEAPGTLRVDDSEMDSELRTKLQAFRDLVRKKNIKTYTDAKDLGSKVCRSLVNLVNSRPSPGWVRGDRGMDEASARRILDLEDKVTTLQRQLEEQRHAPPPGTEDLAQKDECLTLHFSYRQVTQDAASGVRSVDSQKQIMPMSMSWGDLFQLTGPLLSATTSLESFHRGFNELIEYKRGGDWYSDITMVTEDVHTVLYQFTALGYVMSVMREGRSEGWSLTPYGHQVLMKLKAVRSKRPKAT